MRGVWHLLRVPGRDLLEGLERSLDGPAFPHRRGALIFLGLALGWWLYVPVHELLHALACLAAGGTVSELQLSPLYGGALLASVLPFVTAGGEYAGRLSGFETGGSDLVYAVTVLGPYLLTLWPGVWALRLAARRGRPGLFGASLPPALAPFVSLPGDAYELGSVLLTRLGPWRQLKGLLRGDDLTRVAAALAEAGADFPAWSGLVAAFSLGLAWAWLTYLASGALSRVCGQPAL